MRTEFFFKNEPKEYVHREGVKLITDNGILEFIKNQTFGELEIYSSYKQLNYEYLRQIAKITDEHKSVYAIRLKDIDEFKRVIWEKSNGKHEFKYCISETPDSRNVLYYSKQSNVIIFAYSNNEK